MATTELLFNGNDSTTEFQYTFPAITASTDIKAAIDAGDGNGHVDTAAFTLLTSPTRVKFNSAPASGTNNIKIYRETSVETATAVFAAGSAIRAADLNNNFDQLLYSSQDQDRDVATEDLKNLAVTRPKIAADAIDGTKIADDSINSEHYVDGSIDTAHIADDQVTYAKIQNVSTTDRILGRDSSGAGVVEEIAPSALRTMINVEDGATADQTNAEIRAAVEAASDSNVFTNADHTKLNAIEASATADQSNAEIKTAYEANSDTNAYTNTEKTKLSGIATSAEVNVQSDWDASSGDALILNKPSIVAVGGTDGVDFNDNVNARWGSGDDFVITHDGSHSYLKNSTGNIVLEGKSGESSIKCIPDAAVELYHDNTKKFETSATGATVSGALAHELANGKIHLGDGNGDAAPVSISGDATLANTGALTIATDAVEIGMIGCDQTTITDSDDHIPTSGAVVDYVSNQIGGIGGFDTCTTDAAFPNSQPASGIILSIADAGGLVVNGSGTSTTGRTVGGSTVTINGINSQFNSTTVAAGVAMMVESTGSSHTYNYHKATLKEADLINLSSDIDDFGNRYRVASSEGALTGSDDEGDLYFDTGTNKMYVYDGSAWGEVTSTGDYTLLGIKDNGQAHDGTGPTFNGTDKDQYDLFDGTSDASIISAGQLLVVLNGVLQKPNASWSDGGEGFALDGADGIRFCDPPPANSTLFVTQIGTGTTLSVPANDSVTEVKIENGAVTTGKIANNAVDGTKIALGSDAAGDIMYYNGTDYARLGKGTNGHYLKQGSSNAPEWAAGVGGDTGVGFNDDAMVQLGSSNEGQLYHNNSGVTVLRNNADGKDLYLQVKQNSDIIFNANDTGNQNAAIFKWSNDATPVSSVELYYGGVKKAETVTGGFTVTGVCTATSFAGDGSALTGISSPLSFRNLVINGGMNVCQRSVSSTTTNSFTCDRFNVKFNGENEDPTYAQHALTSSDAGPWEKGFRNSLHITNGNQTSNDADDQMFIKYKVEAQDIANSGWDYGSASSKITLSFWLQTSANQTFYGYVYLPDGAGGAQRQYSFSFTASGNDAWTKITKTIPGGGTSNVINNDNGVGLEILLCPGAGGNITASGSTLDAWKVLDDTTWFPDMATTWWDTDDATFEITGVQLEVGDTATEFEHLSYGDELQRCLRYYYRMTPGGNGDEFAVGYNTNTSNCRPTIPFPVIMRTSPTAIEQSGTATDYMVAHGSTETQCNSVPTISGGTPYNMRVVFHTATVLTAGQGSGGRAYNGSAYLGFSAEL